MRFNTKEAWKSVKILSGSETNHHENPTIMMMRIPDGSTATTETENSLVLGTNFFKVFCSDRPIDWYVLDEVRQREFMQEIDQPISWDELKAVVINLTNDKILRLNKVPPNAFKAFNYNNISHLIDFFNKYWLEETDFDE